MKPSERCIELIKQFEGCRLEAYRDQKEVWTVGYGCTGGNVVDGTVWTQEQAEGQLQTRLDAVGRILSGCVMPIITQNQFDALCSLVYNIGPGAFRGSTMLRKLNGRDMAGAAEEFTKWDHLGAAESAGLLRRREAEQALFTSK